MIGLVIAVSLGWLQLRVTKAWSFRVSPGPVHVALHALLLLLHRGLAVPIVVAGAAWKHEGLHPPFQTLV
jgi:hypothetical protein